MQYTEYNINIFHHIVNQDSVKRAFSLRFPGPVVTTMGHFSPKRISQPFPSQQDGRRQKVENRMATEAKCYWPGISDWEAKCLLVGNKAASEPYCFVLNT